MLKIGGKFGDYDVLVLVGKGAMGAVYRIRDPQTGREYACKVMYPEVAKRNPEYRKRFAREAAFAMSIRHPNLITVYDVGEDPETGLCYLIMDYVPGGTVEDRLKRDGRFPIDEAVSVIGHVASALAVADSKKVVHRDIKPANIMFDADGTPKLADLGIARFDDESMSTTVTASGMIVGTPAYMAPEQMTDSHSVDIRADIYSLGMVFFEMLTGQRPNEGCSVVELLAKAIKGENIPDVRTIRPEVSGSVAQVLNLMCAPKPENRISSPQQLLDMFSRLESGKALIAPPAVRRARRMSARRRRRILQRAGFGAGAALLFAVAYLLGSCGRTRAPKLPPPYASPVPATNAPPASAASVATNAPAASAAPATNAVPARPASPATNAAPARTSSATNAAPARASSATNAAPARASSATNAAPARAASGAAATNSAPASVVARAASATFPRAAPRPDPPSVPVAAWARPNKTPFDWLAAAPAASARPLRVAWDFSHGFQPLCSQYTGFTFENVFLGGGMPDGEKYESRPVLFDLARADLQNADILVLPTCVAGLPYTAEDLAAVQRFVAAGGTALVFANEQDAVDQTILLKDYGVVLDVAKDNARRLKGVCPVLSDWTIESSYSFGDDVFVHAVLQTKDAFPMVVTDDDDNLPLMVLRRSGAGKVVFVSSRLFGRVRTAHVNTRWWRTFMTRCVRAGEPGGALKGETLADAPVKEAAGEFTFYGSRRVAARVKAAAKLAERAVPAFARYDLGLSPLPPRTSRATRDYVVSETNGAVGLHESGDYSFIVSDCALAPQHMLIPLLFPYGSAEYRNAPLGINAYLLTLVLEDCGYAKLARADREQIAANPKLGRAVPQFEKLRSLYQDIFARAARVAHREDVRALVGERATEHDVVAILSMAAGADLFPFFNENGVDVSRARSKIALKFVPEGK